MPLFLIERAFAERLELDDDAFSAIHQANSDVGIEWVYSFLSADQKKTYCLYQAECAEDIREAARRLDIPADEIIEVNQIVPEVPLAGG